jgi:hypothetical protein
MLNTETHLTRLFIGDKATSVTNTLSDGQFECQSTAYFIGAVSIAGAITATSTLAVTSTSTLSGLVTASTGVSINGRLILGSTIFGTDAFHGTSASDVVTLSGVQSGDTILAFPYGASVTTSDTLSAVASGDGGAFTVYRPDTAGTSGLTYAYLVIRPA